jgi:hypothetical protein
MPQIKPKLRIKEEVPGAIATSSSARGASVLDRIEEIINPVPAVANI